MKPDGTRSPLTKTDSKYSTNISTQNDLEFSIFARDKYNLTSSLKGSIKLTSKDRFEIWLPKDFDSSELFRKIFEERPNELMNILRVANSNSSSIPKNLAYQILNQIESDYRAKNKVAVAIKTDNLGNLHIKNRYSLFFVYRVLGFNPANQTIRLIYVKPDFDYYFNFLFAL